MYNRYSNQMLVAEADIKKSVEDSIVKANLIIKKWINENNVSPIRIYDEDIRGVFIGQLKRNTFIDRAIDFRKLNKTLAISTFHETRAISSASLSNKEVYWRDPCFVNYLSKALNNADYHKLSYIEEVQTADKLTTTELGNIIDFERLNKIGF